jgi:hypothetical protein
MVVMVLHCSDGVTNITTGNAALLGNEVLSKSEVTSANGFSQAIVVLYAPLPSIDVARIDLFTFDPISSAGFVGRGHSIPNVPVASGPETSISCPPKTRITGVGASVDRAGSGLALICAQATILPSPPPLPRPPSPSPYILVSLGCWGRAPSGDMESRFLLRDPRMTVEMCVLQARWQQYPIIGVQDGSGGA